MFEKLSNLVPSTDLNQLRTRKNKCRPQTDYAPKKCSSETAAPAAGRISTTIAQILLIRPFLSFFWANWLRMNLFRADWSKDPFFLLEKWACIPCLVWSYECFCRRVLCACRFVLHSGFIRHRGALGGSHSMDCSWWCHLLIRRCFEMAFCARFLLFDLLAMLQQNSLFYKGEY